ncbi:hypothetical protein [Evansella halocellulosilytica]|uniref:hypothetical protein n=1 Tax=Evansella halocellulosilytica TaxID=2011013 RepID=UPI001155E9D4|nr:hypothetical protein [Evansella halocellulosilytica]
MNKKILITLICIISLFCFYLLYKNYQLNNTLVEVDEYTKIELAYSLHNSRYIIDNFVHILEQEIVNEDRLKRAELNYREYRNINSIYIDYLTSSFSKTSEPMYHDVYRQSHYLSLLLSQIVEFYETGNPVQFCEKELLNKDDILDVLYDYRSALSFHENNESLKDSRSLILTDLQENWRLQHNYCE